MSCETGKRYIRLMKALAKDQVEQFWREGYVPKIRVMSREDAEGARAALEDYERRTGGPLRGNLRHKAHLLFPFLSEMVRNSRVLDAIEDLYGPNLLCWTSNFFIKEARNPAFVSWHQDATYWGLSSPDVVSAWIALTPSNMANGAMGVIPGSHKKQQLPHRDTFDKNNLLTRGQEVAVEVEESHAAYLELEPGEASLHHVLLVHGSPPNPSNERRIGFAIRYVPPSVRPLHGEARATLAPGLGTVRRLQPAPNPPRAM